MNPEQWIDQVKELFNKARPVDSGLYHLVIVDGQLSLKRKNDLRASDHPIATFDSRDVNQGLTSSRWYSIGCKLASEKTLNPGL